MPDTESRRGGRRGPVVKPALSSRREKGKGPIMWPADKKWTAKRIFVEGCKDRMRTINRKSIYRVVACGVPSGTALDLRRISWIVASVIGRKGTSSSEGNLDLPTTWSNSSCTAFAASGLCNMKTTAHSRVFFTVSIPAEKRSASICCIWRSKEKKIKYSKKCLYYKVNGPITECTQRSKNTFVIINYIHISQ